MSNRFELRLIASKNAHTHNHPTMLKAEGPIDTPADPSVPPSYEATDASGGGAALPHVALPVPTQPQVFVNRAAAVKAGHDLAVKSGSNPVDAARYAQGFADAAALNGSIGAAAAAAAGRARALGGGAAPRFDPHVGLPLCAVACNHCTAQIVPADARFCHSCGAASSSEWEAVGVKDTAAVQPGYAWSIYDPAAGRRAEAVGAAGAGAGAAATPSHNEGGVLFIRVNTERNFTGQAVPRKMTATNVLSGSTINLTRARFIHPKTTINVTSILGGFSLVVPRGVRVITKGVGILGGFGGPKNLNKSKKSKKGGRDDDDGYDTQPAFDAICPVIEVVGVSILAGAGVDVDCSCPPIAVVSA
jgi:hypothetical protein